MSARVLAAGLCLLLLATNALAIPAVPELDPGSASTGIALLAGALLVLKGRRRR